VGSKRFLLGQFREKQSRARSGEDRIQRRLTRRPVVGVVDVAIIREEVGRIVLLLDGGQAVVVVAEGSFNALLAPLPS
jgi:hypothetical protein